MATATKSKLPEGYKVKRNITLPVLQMKEVGSFRVIKITEPIHVSSVPGRKMPDGTQEKPANVCAVIDVETGETMNYLVPAVVQKNLQEMYPKDSYVGLFFYVENMGKRKEGQRYIDYKIMEIDDPKPAPVKK